MSGDIGLGRGMCDDRSKSDEIASPSCRCALCGHHEPLLLPDRIARCRGTELGYHGIARRMSRVGPSSRLLLDIKDAVFRGFPCCRRGLPAVVEELLLAARREMQ